MRSFGSVCLTLAFLGLCLADGSPVYQPGAPYPGDQPIYSPETASFSPSSISPSMSPVTAAPTDLAYHNDGYGDNFAAYPGYETGYGIQNGYEGYLVPSAYSQLATSSGIGPLTYIWSMMPYPSTVLSYVAHAALYVVTGAGILAAGILATLAVCTFTPYCTISFNGFDTHNLREEVRSFMTPDKISAASKFIREAIDKYQRMQKPVSRRR